MLFEITLKEDSPINLDTQGWFNVFPNGLVPIDGEKPVFIDSQSAKNLINQFQAGKKDIVIDYEHQTLTGQVAPAAGWIKELDWRDDGLWAKADWTDKARKHITDKEYRYHSPVFLVEKGTRKIAKLHNVALTNQPKMTGVREIILKSFNNTINNLQENEMMKVKQKLGLPETASEEDCVSAIEALMNKDKPTQEVLKAVTETLSLKADAGKSEIVASINVLKQSQQASIDVPKEIYDVLELKSTEGKSAVIATIHALKSASKAAPDYQKEMITLKNKLAGMERDTLVADAMKQGKITPAQKEWADNYAYSDPDGFRMFIMKSPAIIPVGTVTLPKDTAKSQATIDDATLQIAKMMGIQKSDIEKYGIGGEV